MISRYVSLSPLLCPVWVNVYFHQVSLLHQCEDCLLHTLLLSCTRWRLAPQEAKQPFCLGLSECCTWKALCWIFQAGSNNSRLLELQNVLNLLRSLYLATAYTQGWHRRGRRRWSQHRGKGPAVVVGSPFAWWGGGQGSNPPLFYELLAWASECMRIFYLQFTSATFRWQCPTQISILVICTFL